MPLPAHMAGAWTVHDSEHWRLDENFTKLSAEIPDKVAEFSMELGEDGAGSVVLGDAMTMIVIFDEAASTAGLYKGHGLVRHSKLDALVGSVASLSLSYTAKDTARLTYTWVKGKAKKTSGYTMWTRV